MIKDTRSLIDLTKDRIKELYTELRKRQYYLDRLIDDKEELTQVLNDYDKLDIYDVEIQVLNIYNVLKLKSEGFDKESTDINLSLFKLYLQYTETERLSTDELLEIPVKEEEIVAGVEVEVGEGVEAEAEAEVGVVEAKVEIEVKVEIREKVVRCFHISIS